MTVPFPQLSLHFVFTIPPSLSQATYSCSFFSSFSLGWIFILFYLLYLMMSVPLLVPLPPQIECETEALPL